jgi:hypothetical protein
MIVSYTSLKCGGCFVDWYYIVKGEKKGPVEAEVIKSLITDKVLTASDLVWNSTMGDKWAKIQEVPILHVPVLQQWGNQPKADFQKAYQLHAKERRVRAIIGASVVIVLVVLGNLTVRWIRNAPLRHWGVDSKNPLGQFAILDNILAVENKMDKMSVTNCALTYLQAEQMYAYSNPKAEHGAYVTTAGMITLLLDADGKIKGIHALFPASGARGASGIVNESVVGMFIKEYWDIVGQRKSVRLDPISKAAPKSLEPFALITTLPENCIFDVFACREGHNRVLWLEYGRGSQATMVLMLRAED